MKTKADLGRELAELEKELGELTDEVPARDLELHLCKKMLLLNEVAFCVLKAALVDHPAPDTFQSYVKAFEPYLAHLRQGIEFLEKIGEPIWPPPEVP